MGGRGASGHRDVSSHGSHIVNNALEINRLVSCIDELEARISALEETVMLNIPPEMDPLEARHLKVALRTKQFLQEGNERRKEGD